MELALSCVDLIEKVNDGKYTIEHIDYFVW